MIEQLNKLVVLKVKIACCKNFEQAFSDLMLLSFCKIGAS